ncbi:MAG: PPC domain-containing protein [Thermoflexales bacterium]|nr:PPC domain-containing protein [Thermoflexales bacterium]
MQTNKRWLSLSASLTLALVGVLAVLSVMLPGNPEAVRAAPALPVSSPCNIRAISVTAALGRAPGVSDTLPYSNTSRTLFYAPPATTGTITLSVLMDILTSTTWYLYGGPAFGNPITSYFQATQAQPWTDMAYKVYPQPRTTQTIALAAWPESGTVLVPCQTLSFVPDEQAPGSSLTVTATQPVRGQVPIQLDWTAQETGSGVYSITLLYRKDAGPWQPYLDSLVHGALSGGFVFTPPQPPQTRVVYSFASVARDHLGHTEALPGPADAQVEFWPERFKIYLPLIVKNFWPCMPVDTEPNDAFNTAQIIALSPVSGLDVRRGAASGNFCINDQDDYYVIATTGQVLSITLNVPAGLDMDMYVYDRTHQAILTSTTSSDEQVHTLLPPGQYYIRVHRAGPLGPAYATPYTLSVSDSMCSSMDSEPNDSFEQAQIIALSGQNVPRGAASGNFCLGDTDDYFWLTASGAFMAVTLAGAPGVELDLYGYDAVRTPVFTLTTTGDESVLRASTAGTFYLKVHPVGSPGLAHLSPYTLTVEDIPQPVVNGSFEKSDWTGWAHGRGPFNWSGHDYGTGLTATIGLSPNQWVLLGNPIYDTKNGSIPVGYAYISQTIYVPASVPTLTLSYRVHSFDTVYGLTSNEYFDNLEVSINQAPGQITREQREAVGCRGNALNPNNATYPVSAGGLVFCAGGPVGNTAEWDSSWRKVRLNLSAFAGSKVTLYAALWSREYTSIELNDRAHRNTYAYLDDVMMTLER